MIPQIPNTPKDNSFMRRTRGGNIDYAPEGGQSAIVSPRTLDKFRQSQAPAQNADVTEVPAKK
jgi:hypothetical protein